MYRSLLLSVAGLLVALLALSATHAALATARSPHHVSHHAPAGILFMGKEQMRAQAAFQGYYDGWKDTYLNTDTSSKSQAAAWHINYSPALAAVHGAPAIYLVQGRAAAHQLAVFGSEPGESDYSPLWRETVVTFKRGVRAVLLTSDNQINALAKKGSVTVRVNGTILNCPVVKVGKHTHS